MAINTLYGFYYDDPNDFDGNNKKCELCEKEALVYDDFCEDHEPCEDCNSNEQCEKWCENKKDYEKK
mgnify:CR=1 FL=1|tara:strand:+ start:2989 stop:3189 length:201 start_codon:yes stop_codon:yes gene_type:complete